MMGVFVDAGVAALIVEDPIATYLVALFEDDHVESEEDAILGRGNAAGARADDANALVRNHDRLSLDRVIFRGLKSLAPLTDSRQLAHTASDRFAQQVYELPTRMLAGGQPVTFLILLLITYFIRSYRAVCRLNEVSGLAATTWRGA